MFLETSRPVNPGWKARLVSKYIGMRVACLKFWYHAFGDDAHMGSLQLVIKTNTVCNSEPGRGGVGWGGVAGGVAKLLHENVGDARGKI